MQILLPPKKKNKKSKLNVKLLIEIGFVWFLKRPKPKSFWRLCSLNPCQVPRTCRADSWTPDTIHLSGDMRATRPLTFKVLQCNYPCFETKISTIKVRKHAWWLVDWKVQGISWSKQWRSHWGCKGGRVPPLTAKNLPKIGKKRKKFRKYRGKEEKSGRKGRNREG